jgi:hypothetical protein
MRLFPNQLLQILLSYAQTRPSPVHRMKHKQMTCALQNKPFFSLMSEKGSCYGSGVCFGFDDKLFHLFPTLNSR